MNKEAVELYFSELEDKLLNHPEPIPVEPNRAWTGKLPSEAAVYIFREDGIICNVGETENLRDHMQDLFNFKNRDLETLLGDLIVKHLTLSYILVDLGRKELEERLFGKLQSQYSLRGKRGAKKSYTVGEKQKENKNAYEPWSAEADKQLELLFCEGKTVQELSGHFGRNEGSIISRIKKLELREKYGQ